MITLNQKCIEQSDTKLYENIYVYSLLKPVSYLKKMMNFMKMRTFYKKLPLFIKNCPLLFIKNSMLQIVIYKKLNFWEEYTPLSQ